MKNKVILSLVFVFISLILFLPQTVDASQLSVGRSAILMDSDSGRVLYEKNSREKLPMASTTKIATALTVLKHANLDEVVTVTKQAVGVEGSSIYLREGEKLTVEELLYGLMLRSGNDSAVALAIHVGGSIDGFVSLMNAVAIDIGALDTNFVNPHGLHDDNHYTTAYDLALITKEALNNAAFSKIVSTKSTKISNEGYDYMRVLVNKNKLLSNYKFADGVKTGYTKRAGRCFVGSATKDNMQLIAVVLNCGPMFENAQSMLEFGFSEYTMTNIIPKNKVCGVVFNKGRPTYFYCKEGLWYPLSNEEKERVNCNVEISSDIEGRITATLDGVEIYSCKLVNSLD